MNDLVEVRGANHAFEMRNGTKVEYAAGDRESRMRALGCPEPILVRMRERKRTGHRSATITKSQLAASQGLTVAQMDAREDEARRSVARVQGRKLSADGDRERRERAERLGAQIAAEAAKDKAENHLRSRMESNAGIVCGRRSKADKEATQLEGQEGSQGEFNALQSALEQYYPGHKLLGYSASQQKAFSQHTSGTKFTVPYERDSAGYSFGKPVLGGHPMTLGDVS